MCSSDLKERMDTIIRFMEDEGAKNVLGREPDARIPGLSSERALCTEEGIFNSDVILVPIEDGDRAEALVKMGKVVISIDLNPISRTSKTATVSISDDISRALENIRRFAIDLKKNPERIVEVLDAYDNSRTRREMIETICYALKNEFN